MSKARKPAPPPARKPAAAATTATIALAIALVVALIALAVWAAGSPVAPPAVAPTEAASPRPPAPPVAERRPAPRTSEVARPKAPDPEEEPEEEPDDATATAVAAPEFATAWARGPTEVVRVKRVVDGDTLELSDGRKVRLVGINTPERGQPLYSEASEALKELADGAQVTLEFDEERTDQYKRTLAYAFKGELFINGEIVRRGLAYCYTWEPNTAHQDEFVTFQRQARGARRGLWSLTPPAPESVYIADTRGHRFHRGSCGRVGRISKRLEFKSRDEAFDAGQNPCDECRP